MTILEITSINPVIPSPPPTSLYIEDIMTDLGVSRATIYRWIDKGVGPPFYKISDERTARPRCDRDDYERWKQEKKERSRQATSN